MTKPSSLYIRKVSNNFIKSDQRSNSWDLRIMVQSTQPWLNQITN